MFRPFLDALRGEGVPVSLREYLDFLAGLGAGVFRSVDDIAKLWRLDRKFTPLIEAKRRDALYGGWCDAVERVRSKRR